MEIDGLVYSAYPLGGDMWMVKRFHGERWVESLIHCTGDAEAAIKAAIARRSWA